MLGNIRFVGELFKLPSTMLGAKVGFRGFGGGSSDSEVGLRGSARVACPAC